MSQEEREKQVSSVPRVFVTGQISKGPEADHLCRSCQLW